MKTTMCNMCGRIITSDDQCAKGFHDIFCYGSEFDGDSFNLDLCGECVDIVAKEISAKCRHNPFSDGHE